MWSTVLFLGLHIEDAFSDVDDWEKLEESILEKEDVSKFTLMFNEEIYFVVPGTIFSLCSEDRNRIDRVQLRVDIEKRKTYNNFMREIGANETIPWWHFGQEIGGF